MVRLHTFSGSCGPWAIVLEPLDYDADHIFRMKAKMGCVDVSVRRGGGGCSGLFTLASSVSRYRLYFELQLMDPDPFVVAWHLSF
jgi:hypothetical protein